MVDRDPLSCKRGVIIVDSVSLTDLAAFYNPHAVIPGSSLSALAKPTGTYLDLLIILARHGYDIVIPEMVSMESGQILADGKNVGLCFGGLEQKSIYRNESVVIQFLTNIKKGAYKGIRIEQARGNAPYALYLNEMRQAVDKRFWDEFDKGQSRSSTQRTIMNIQETDTKNFGEAHAFDIIKDILEQAKDPLPAPVFFLSPDYNARKDLAQSLVDHPQASRVNVLAISGIIDGLKKDKDGPGGVSALARIGLSGSIQSHWRQIKLENDHSKLPKYGISADGYYDSPLGKYDTKEFPFAKSLKGLAAELAYQQQIETQQIPKQPSPLEKFRAKYGNRYGNGQSHPQAPGSPPARR